MTVCKLGCFSECNLHFCYGFMYFGVCFCLCCSFPSSCVLEWMFRCRFTPDCSVVRVVVCLSAELREKLSVFLLRFEEIWLKFVSGTCGPMLQVLWLECTYCYLKSIQDEISKVNDLCKVVNVHVYKYIFIFS